MSAVVLAFVAFVQTVLGVRLTPAQRVLCAVAFDGVEPCDLEGADREIARRIFGDVATMPPEARAVLVAVCGARSGKSYLLAALYSLWRALTADLSRLAPGEVAVAVIVAPDLRLARQSLRYALGASRSVPSIARLITNEGSDGFVLRRPDGGLVSIEVLPAGRGGSALRGRTLVSAVLDEASFFRDDSSVVNDVELFRAVSPRVLPGGLVIIASTPWAESGLLHTEFTRNHGKPSTAIAAHAPTLVMRDDDGTRAIVQREQERDPENARREYGAEFAANTEALFAPEDIDAAVEEGRGESERVTSTSYACALDLAIRHDFTVCLVGHRELRSRAGAPPVEVLVLDLARHWKPEKARKLDVDELEVEVAAIATRYRARIDADGWGFDFFEARMKARGIACECKSMASTEQTRRASQLATLFRQRRIILPDVPELVRQLKQFRVTRTPGGHLRFAAPDRRGHADDYPKALTLLVERAMTLPPSGGDIRSEWRHGHRHWFRPNPDGTRTPCQPPLGSRDWLDLCVKAEREGFETPEMAAWLSEPANREAVERHAERGNGLKQITEFINRF